MSEMPVETGDPLTDKINELTTTLEALRAENARLDAETKADWMPEASAQGVQDAIMTYAPKYLKGMAALPDMAIGAADYMTGGDIIPDEARLRNAVDWLSNGQEQEATSTLGKGLSRATEFLGGVGGGGVVGKALGGVSGAAPKIPYLTKALSGTGEVLQARPGAQVLSALSGATTGQLAEEMGYSKPMQTFSEMVGMFGPEAVYGTAKGVKGLGQWLFGSAKNQAEERAGGVLRALEKGADAEGSLVKPIEDYRKDISAIYPQESVVGATGKEGAKTVAALTKPSSASELRGNLVISDIESAKSAVGAEASKAEVIARDAFDTMKPGQKNLVKGAISQMKKVARNFPATATEADKGLINFISRVDNALDHPLDNLIAIRSKAVEAQKAGSTLAGDILKKLDGNEAGKIGGVVGKLPPKAKNAYIKTVVANAKSIPFMPDEPMGKLVQGQVQAGVGKRYKVSPEEIFTNKVTGEKGLAGSSRNAEDVVQNLAPKAKGALQADTKAFLLSKEAGERVKWMDVNEPALRKLFGPVQYKAIRETLKGEGQTIGSWLHRNAPALARFALVRATGPVLAKGAGAALGAGLGTMGGPLGVIAGTALGGAAASKIASHLGGVDEILAELLKKAGDDPKFALTLLGKVNPHNIRKALKNIGFGLEHTAIMQLAGEQGNENTDMGTESFPKKKLTTEPMTTNKPTEAKLAPVSYSPDLVKLQQAVITQESGGNPTAVSRAGAQGLMQLMPETGKDMMRRLGLNPKDYDPYNPDLNKQLGTEYLRMLRGRYDGDVELALAAYNWGMGNLERAMKKYGTRDFNELVKKMGIGGRYGMPRETAEYVPSVLARLHKINTLEV